MEIVITKKYNSLAQAFDMIENYGQNEALKLSLEKFISHHECKSPLASYWEEVFNHILSSERARTPLE